MLGLEDELLLLVAVGLEALAVLVFAHLLTTLFYQRTHPENLKIGREVVPKRSPWRSQHC